MILRVGLTGGIASGKSTIVRMLAELGCRTVDADAIVADLYRPGRPGHEAIVRAYGLAVLNAQGEIDRKALSAIAFSNPDQARKLNSLIHPLVIAEQGRLIEEAEAEGADSIWVVEATLLIESGGRSRFDRIVVVDVDPGVQIERAVGRGMERGEVLRRIANQLPREERLRHADYVVDNSGDEAAARSATARLYERLREDLEAGKKNAPGGTPYALT